VPGADMCSTRPLGPLRVDAVEKVVDDLTKPFPWSILGLVCLGLRFFSGGASG
jgi:hypothetical protein